MDLITLENLLDNAAFLVLFLTLFAYWIAVVFPKPWLTQLASTGMAIANLTITPTVIWEHNPRSNRANCQSETPAPWAKAASEA